MPTVRKVKSKAGLPAKKEAVLVVPKKEEALEGREDGTFNEAVRTKKVCQFCKSKTEPAYWDAAALRRFVSDRGRILPRGRSGACAKHQRRVSREIKRARLLALLAFAPQI